MLPPHFAVAGLLLLSSVLQWTATVVAQPSPQLQKRISQAIKAAGNLSASEIDYTEFVNVFIGTDNFGDVW